MAIVIPGTAVNYPNALLAVGLNFNNSPAEGYRSLPAEIAWGTMGGADKVVSMNAQTSGGTVQLSQICALHVDNSACGSDVQFVFTDTQETYTVAAYTPYALFPVFSKSLQFYVIAGINNEIVNASDLTRFSMFNFVPPPIVLPTSEEQQFAFAAAISAATVGSTTLIAAGTNGRLENVDIFAQMPVQTDPNRSVVWRILDGASTPHVYASGTVGAFQAAGVNIPGVFRGNGLSLTFQNGLYFEVVSSNIAPDGTFSVNVVYRSP